MTTTLPPKLDASPDATPAPTRPRLPYPVRIVLIGVAMLANILLAPLVLGLPLQWLINSVEMPQDLILTLSLVTRLMPVAGSIVIVWAFMKFIDRRPFREAGLVFSKFSLPWLLVGAVVGLIAIVPAGWLLQNAGMLRPDDSAISSVSPLWTFLTAMVLGLFTQGFPEEFLWRGYGLQTMRYRPMVAVLVSGLAFGAMHLVSEGGQQGFGEKLLYLAGPTAFAIAAGMLAVVARSIWPAVGVHFGNHLAFYLGSLFGMGTGPALWLAEGAVFLAVAAIIYFTNRQAFATPIALER